MFFIYLSPCAFGPPLSGVSLDRLLLRVTDADMADVVRSNNKRKKQNKREEQGSLKKAGNSPRNLFNENRKEIPRNVLSHPFDKTTKPLLVCH